MNNKCQNLFLLFNQLQTEKSDFDNAFNSEDFTQAKALKQGLRARLAEIDKLIWPFKNELVSQERITERYNRLASLYDQNNITVGGEIDFELSTPNGEIEKRYPMPTLDQVFERLRQPDKKEQMKKLISLGLTKMWLVPICGVGDPVKTQSGEYTNPLTWAVAQKLRAKKADHELFIQIGPNESDITEVGLDPNSNKFDDAIPLWMAADYTNLKYRRRLVDADGNNTSTWLTLEQRLAASKEENIDIAPGWRLVFTEENTTVKRTRETGDKLPQFTSYISANGCETILERIPEITGLTVEDELIILLDALDQPGPVVIPHDYKNPTDGSTWLLGNSLPDGQPIANWDRWSGGFVINWNVSNISDDSYGAVPLGEL